MFSDQVIRAIEADHGWTKEFIEELAPYYLATLTRMSRGQVTPVVKIIDELWHTHILLTRDYADFCHRQFGRFIHHERFEDDLRTDTLEFFDDFGLSVDSLYTLCGKLGSDQEMVFGRCGSGQPPRSRDVNSPRDVSDLILAARCGPPAPAPAPVPGQPPRETIAPTRLDIARCGQPDEPEPPNVTREGLRRQPYGIES